MSAKDTEFCKACGRTKTSHSESACRTYDKAYSEAFPAKPKKERTFANKAEKLAWLRTGLNKP